MTVTSSCSGLLVRVTNTGGIIRSNQDTYYSNNMDCQWKISSNVMLQLVFIRFSTESNYDILTVYNGGSSSSPVIGRFNGSSLPPSITSSSGQLYLRFTSDGSVTKEGFLANYQGVLLLVNIHAHSVESRFF